ncbi:MAG: FAD-dependent oxidoreductase [Deltaproteobacteria bacterium]|nr:FAD-dependent oxidoreductase [Kofleriaceae bacterium]
MIDVAVIGSGYGGAVVAARLARHARVLLIERGAWWRPGDFPETMGGLARAYMGRDNPGGLWSMRLGVGTGLAFASAFGGSSAVNYGITARPDDHAFAGWPVTAHELARWFARAERELEASPNPRAAELPDRAVLDELEPGCRVDLENTIDWASCDHCGKCVPGCNRGAKRSLDRTYLAHALRNGVELRLRTEVRSLAAVAGGYRLELVGKGGTEWVSARRVVLAAGALGTLDLLHRSRVPLGPLFGRRMSMNGDGLAFLYDTRRPLATHDGADPVMQFAAARLRAWAERIGGVVVPDVATLPGMRSFSVHPLGGCRMGADISDGVVDGVGRVFDPSGGVHPGLRIADGSVLRGSLGVPPSLTIAALSERIAADLERELATRAP